MIEQKQFNGVLNNDDANDILPAGHHKDAQNIIFRGNGNNMRAENLPGNRLVSNSLLPSGTNMTIGTHYDSVNNRIIIFNYNSNSNHGIYIFNTLLGTFQRILQSGTGTDGDILGFTATPITSINIIYGDPNDGDILYFVDTLGRPTKLNINRFLAGTYTTVYRSFIDVAKMPPSNPIKAAYGADTTVNNNNLNNGLYQFIYRFVYDDNEKSVWSTGSELPLPYLPNNDGSIANAKYLNNYISLWFPTGDVNVKSIELAFRETRDGATSDYMLITSLSKSSLSIGSNDVYNYNFYKSGVYTFVDKVEQILLFDYVPLKANTQELLNGETLIYGGITEGYNNTAVTASVTQTYGDMYTSRNGLLFGAEQISTNTIKIFIDGTVGSTTGTLAALVGSSFQVFYTNIGGANDSVSYYATTESISDTLNGLRTAAISKGFTGTISGNTLTIVKSNIAIGPVQNEYDYTGMANKDFDVFGTLYTNANYQYGIVYYDQNGKTNGVNTVSTLKLNTNYSGLYPNPETEVFSYRDFTITSVPPSWAKYYQIVRTNNLSYGDKALYWVSSGAFSDKDVSVNQKYAYLRIDNIYDYNLSIKATEGVVGYDFSAGDRVKFIKRYNSSGAVAIDLSYYNYDYPVLSVETNPVMNGIAKDGAYLKIAYPTSDIGANLFFDGTGDSQNFEIFIYNPAQTVSATEQTYFEIGQKLPIISGYHSGYQTQTASQPAKVRFTDWDVYYRLRKINVTPAYQIQGQGSSGSGYSGYVDPYVTLNIGDAASVVTSPVNYSIGYSVKQIAGLAVGSYPKFSDAYYNYYNKSGVDYNVRFQTSFEAWLTGSSGQSALRMYVKLYNASVATSVQILNAQSLNIINSTTSPTVTINIDAVVKVPAGYKASLIFTNDTPNGNLIHISACTMNITPLNTINIYADDPSFSDVYKIEKNSTSRPLVVDVNAKQTYYSTMVRYSQAFQLGTSINGTNRFYYLDYDNYDRKYGDIMRMKLHNKDLRIFQYKKCGVVPVYSTETSNQDGSSNLVASTKIINPIRYYEGDFGVGNQGASLASSGYADYFADPVKGYFVRLSQDGITPISEIYKMQTFAGNNLPNYLKSNNYTGGGVAKVLGVFYFTKDKNAEYITSLQAGGSLTGYTLSFDEIKNCYTSFYSFQPEWMVAYENKLATFKNGNLYIHDSSTQNNFYGTQYSSSITFVFNKDNIVKKTYNSLTIDATDYWTSPTMGNVNTSLGQSSNIVSSDYEIHEGLYHAALQRDNNSLGGVINGDYLKGTWTEIKLTNSATSLVYLSGIYLGYILSNRNM